jgi:predicted HD phosphohydrolase
MVKTACYRVAQFFHALTAQVSDEEVEQAIHILTPEAQALFGRQAIQDQRHALAVYRALQQGGYTNPHLLAAALLHDVGKAATRLAPYHRAIVVLLGRFAPRLLARLGQGRARWWNRPFVAHAQHPETGARWAQEANCSLLAVALIRRHEEEPTNSTTEEDQFRAALQAADSTN